jgi:hypothetical protein
MVRTLGWVKVVFPMAALVIFGVGSASAAGWRVTVRGHGGGGDLGETPLVAEIKASVPPGDYVLDPGGDGPKVRARVFVDDGKTYLGTVLNRVAGKGSVTFAPRPDVKTDQTPPGVELRKNGANLEVLAGGKPWTVYLTDNGSKPTYFPVIGPTGATITRAYPMKDVAGETRDHPHQRSLWFSHGNVNGFDFWASDPINKPSAKFGSIKETGRPTVVSGAAVGVVRTTDDWLGPDGKKVCEDERVVRFYDTTNGRVFDFDITIKATAGPVTFGDTKEGMFGIRVASSMDVKNKKGGKITNAEGISDDEAWGKASPWVDYVGPVEGKTVGIAILNHPDSFRYPTTWHVRTYGLFAANPFGWHDFGRKDKGDHTIPAGGSIRFRYRVILHEGDTASAQLPDAFRGYAEPPSIEVQAD